MSSNRKKKSKDQKQDPLRTYARYSGIVFQMVAVILLFYFAGKKIDQVLDSGNSLATILGLLIGVIAAMILTIRSINKK